MPWLEYHDEVTSQWYTLLKSNPEEDAVQAFLELHPAMVPGGSGDVGPGGHHGSEMGAVFTRPKLKGDGRDFVPDFMWVTRSSGLITPILIEIEKPSKRWFTKAGRPTADFTAAHDQLNDWRSWFERDANGSLFRNTFLVGERYANRPLRPQYVLIYGRKSEFDGSGGHSNPDEIRHKRDGQLRPDEAFMTFDSLRPRYDHANSVTVMMTAKGPIAYAFSPVYQTSPSNTGHAALTLGDPMEALGRTVMMSDERKAYLAERWAHWREKELAARLDPRGTYPRSLGRE
jgi:hypothetical protein